MVAVGPIPARAGEPCAASMCGDLVAGLSPLARGNLARSRAVPSSIRAYPRSRGGTWAYGAGAACHGPIPARAGEPQSFKRCRITHRAYPRSRGGTAAGTMTLLPWAYPRSRGGTGMILCRCQGGQGAYPRSRGGTRTFARLYVRRQGLSPLARGNRCGRAPGVGQPVGLSPLARGNRGQMCYARWAAGPIPARAGEPLYVSRWPGRLGPIPARAGEPFSGLHFAERSSGLSPLARGNLPGVPASCRTWAYPRSRGGTRRGLRAAYSLVVGLSPLARGNRPRSVLDGMIERGLSPLARGNLGRLGVRQAAAGLSPLARGNHRATRE